MIKRGKAWLHALSGGQWPTSRAGRAASWRNWWQLSCSPADDYSAAFLSGLSAQAGEQFTRRLDRHQLPTRDGVLRWTLPGIGELRWDREILELPPSDAQQLTVLLPADSATDEAATGVLRAGGSALRVVN